MDVDRRALFGLGVAGAALATAGVASAEAVADVPSSVDLTGDDGRRFAPAVDDIRAYAAQHMAAYGLPGLTISLVGPAGFAAFLQFGLSEAPPAASGHLFQIGSISKSFTALCIFHLIDAGKLHLEDDVRDLLPGVPLPEGKTTVQSLLNHSSGLPDDAPVFPRGGDGRLWRGFAPGTQWSYSNLGFLLLGMIAERLEGEPLAQVMRRRILEPLGMTSTKGAIVRGDRALYALGHAPLYGDRGYPRAGPLAQGPWTAMTAGSGCVASTAADMARYARFLIAVGQGKGAPILSDAAAARFAKATIDAPGWAVPGAKYANGLAVVPVGGRMLLHHTGGMLIFNSAIHVDPQAAVGAFASTNVGLAPYRPRAITAYACARLRAVVEGGPIPQPEPAPPKAPEIGDYLGRYEARGQAVLIASAAPSGLSVRLGDEVFHMDPGGDDDAFICSQPRLMARPVVFRRNGKAVTRVWHDGVEYVRVEGGRPVAPFSPPTPPALLALTGEYRSDDPWEGSFRVTAQGEALFIDDTAPLTPMPGGLWRIGEKAWSPERLSFEAMLDGRPQRAVQSGVDHLRRPG